MNPISRRRMLKTTGGALLALPFLESFHLRAAEAAAGKCLVAINMPLGLYSHSLFPKDFSSSSLETDYLAPFKPFHDKMTLISGAYHPGVANGHVSTPRIFTGTPNMGGPDPKLAKNGESIDQCAARHIGDQTRFASLTLSMGNSPHSWHANGMAVPAFSDMDEVFKKLFVADAAGDRKAAKSRLAAKGSVLDAVMQQANALKPALSGADQDKLEEYFHAVRETEKRVVKNNSWLDTPKPKVGKAAAFDDPDPSGFIPSVRNLLNLTHLALETDSTRVVACDLFRQGNVGIDGVSNGYHSLSHHGKDPENIKQLQIIETAVLAELHDFIEKLSNSRNPDGSSLLDRTHVVLVSNLGNASSHSSLDLPVVLFGGGLDHRGHLHFQPTNTTPLCNVYLSVLESMGIKEPRFGTSTGTLPQLLRS